MGNHRDELNRVLRGWASYFAYGSPHAAFRLVDTHVARARAQSPEEATPATKRDWQIRIRRVARCTRRPRPEKPPQSRMPDVKPVRELDAGNPHVQFDEGVKETDRGRDSARWVPRERLIAAGAANPKRHRASTPPLHLQSGFIVLVFAVILVRRQLGRPHGMLTGSKARVHVPCWQAASGWELLTARQPAAVAGAHANDCSAGGLGGLAGASPAR